MKSYIISAWLVLLSTTAYLQKVNCADTPLMSAVKKDDVDLVKRLLANGADAKETNLGGWSALMFAAAYGDDKTVKLLIPKSDVKATNEVGRSALMFAASSGNDKLVRLLLPNSNVKASDQNGETALMIATRYGDIKLVKLLLPNSDVTATNKQGQNALDLAKYRGLDSEFIKKSNVKRQQEYEILILF